MDDTTANAQARPGPFTPERLDRLQAEGLPQETLTRQQEIDDALMAELQGPAPERSPVGQAIDFMTPEDPMRALRLGAQGTLRGAVADTLGMPVDMLTALMNAGIDVGNLIPPLFGSEAQMPNITNPVGGSQSIADAGAAGARAVGIPVEDPNALEGSERLGYNINRFGSGAGVAGLGLAARAATTLPKAAPSANPFVRVVDGLTDAYRGSGAGRTLSADVAAGAGAGAGLTAAEGFETDNPYARAGVDTAAMLTGGLAGAGGVAGMGRAFDLGMIGANLTPDPSIPFRLGTGVSTSRRIGDLAGRIAQDAAADPQAAAAQIRETTAASRAAGDPLPTSGLASDDVGLIGLERTIRNDPQLATQFATRDEALQTGAADRVGEMRDPGADFAAPQRSAQGQIDAQMADAQTNLAAARAEFDQVEAGLRAAQTGEARGQTVRAALEDAKEAARKVERAAWSDVYGEVDPAPLAQRFESRFNALTPSGQRMVNDVRAAIDTPSAITPDAPPGPQPSAILDASGRPFMREPKPVSQMRDLADITELRGEFTDAIRAAEAAGNPNKARVLGQFVDEIDLFLDGNPEIATALDNARAVSRDLNDRFTRRGTPIADALATRPSGGPARPDSEVARSFVQPDEGQASNIGRLLTETESLSSAPQVREAIQDQILADVNKQGLLERPDRLEQYLGQYESVFERFPDVRQSLGTAAGLRRAVADAETNLADLKRTLGDRNNVLRTLASEPDARNLAQRIFGGNRYGTDGLVRQINEAVKGSPEATRAWRASVADVLADRVTKASDGTLNVRELNRVYNKHRDALAEIYTPAEMASLDRASEMLAPLANLSRGVKGGQTSAPPTDIYARIEGAMLLSGENAVTTGMIVKRIKTAAKFVGLDKLTAEYKTARVIEMMQFNPDLAVHLLERPVSEGVSAAWNQRLQNLMAGAQGARGFNEMQDDEEPTLEDMIME